MKRLRASSARSATILSTKVGVFYLVVASYAKLKLKLGITHLYIDEAQDA